MLGSSSSLILTFGTLEKLFTFINHFTYWPSFPDHYRNIIRVGCIISIIPAFIKSLPNQASYNVPAVSLLFLIHNFNTYLKWLVGS